MWRPAGSASERASERTIESDARAGPSSTAHIGQDGSQLNKREEKREGRKSQIENRGALGFPRGPGFLEPGRTKARKKKQMPEKTKKHAAGGSNLPEDDTCLNQLWEENEVRDICGLAMESVGPREGLGVR
mgnify:CR=1 FL=1